MLEVQDAQNECEVLNDKQKNEQSQIANAEKLNYTELMAHIRNTHPTNDEAPNAEDADYVMFSICDRLGSLKPSIPCCKTDTPTLMARQLGLGPTLFLMSTKAFACLFFFLTILNIPVLMFYATGNSMG